MRIHDKRRISKIKTYEEFDEKRKEMKGLDFSDPEIMEHCSSIFPRLKSSGYEDGVIYEVFPNKEIK